MRRLSLFLLLASAAVPALAQVDDKSRDERRAERRAEREARADSEPQQAERKQERAERREERAERVQERADRRAVRIQGQEMADGPAGPLVEPIRERRRVRAREDLNRGGGDLQPRQRRVRTIPDAQPSVTPPTAPVETNRRDYRDGQYRRWTGEWRHDRRYDWRRWRDRHRSRFHLGFYYDPFGWTYRRWNIGWFMWPSYYHSRYWLHDPWMYRLPPAYGPYRWVRYWDDALLVNIYTGRVVDVIHNFFW